MTRLRDAALTRLLPFVIASTVWADDPPELEGADLEAARSAGLGVFATPFNNADGFGDGNDAGPSVALGERPSLGGNGSALRVNGLDARTCLECHSIISNDTVPATFGVGGSGSTATMAMFMPSEIDPQTGRYTGRFIDPLALFGVGGVELLAKEMTADLQALAEQALADPGRTVVLETKGVGFGSIVARRDGSLDTSDVEGVDTDLVLRPFGRKGEFATVHQFDLIALRFHMGIEPSEVVGSGIDADGDGVSDEIGPQGTRDLHVFLTTQERPGEARRNKAESEGAALFDSIGCTECHRPMLTTTTRYLTFSDPLIEREPFANPLFRIDLSRAPSGFRTTPDDGLEVPLFSDLKRHDMGEGLAETFDQLDAIGNREFVTAKLWGVADTAPYLHDGRAHTLNEAIVLHGGEAQWARQNYLGLTDEDRAHVIDFLRTLRNPEDPNADVLGPKGRPR